ncbi:competence protein ComFA [Streptococcus equinus]|uniref:Competence protein ComFA n=1 Tax=Streptococcus equinus TaxID=1335 RepID=A0A1H0Q3P0_STREI|nr:DEAD/DEAH box helicase [Streptococcus equinus]SDP11993.1 competence protein ComFA [Streptococcus equinus]
MTELNDYYGRIFTESQLTDDLKKEAKVLPSVKKEKGQMICNRCGRVMAANQMLQTGRIYCRECLTFGRNTSDSNLYYFPQIGFPETKSLIWQGELTPYQKEVSQGMLAGIAQKSDLLAHAVTGAGKTEMIYQSVASVIDQGGCVCLASPRIDVCLELYNRLSRDFSCPITLLHGDSEAYKRSPLIIATTHQLLKFYRAFDLLIIDEVDAFPFVDNKMLYHAVNQSIKDDGVKIFLTATSTDELDKKVKKGELTKLHLARRFHANPLVVPKMVWLGGLLSSMEKGKIPNKLISLLKKQRQSHFPLLIFFPNIEQGKQFSIVLQETFPDEAIAFVSSQTENRLELVEQFRKKELTVLVTTTILERGVTFPCVDVFVLLANHRLYSKSALVQIAGRVGRSVERPTGELLFLHDGTTKAMQKAITEIKEMNKKGGFG